MARPSKTPTAKPAFDLRAPRPRRVNALSDRVVDATKAPGIYADGRGLYIIVKPNSGGSVSKRWLLRIALGQPKDGRADQRRDLGLGSYPDVGVADARFKAAAIREAKANGRDPFEVHLSMSGRHQSHLPEVKAILAAKAAIVPPKIVTFADVHAAWWATKPVADWSEQHVKKIMSQFVTYALPTLGPMDVAKIALADVKAVLTPIWARKIDTADNLASNLKQIFDLAIVDGHRTDPNPVILSHLRKSLPNRPKTALRVKHRTSLGYAHINPFMLALRSFEAEEITRLALEFLILNGSRDSEVCGATWGEIDLRAKTWTIPATRHKAGKTAADSKDHIIPLSGRSLAILDAARKLSPLAGPTDFIFPGQARSSRRAGMLSENTLANLSKSVAGSAGLDPTITAHGFRSTFRTWGAETGAAPREVLEAALAHTNGDRVEAAYARSDYLSRRRALMEAWARYIDAVPAKDEGSNVVDFGQRTLATA